MEESGKAIAIHERRVRICHLPEGTPFRCEDLDALLSSHKLKLEAVYDFLLDEQYWFDVEAPDHDANKALLGSVKKWAGKHDKAKQRGFYVELDSLGNALSPSDIKDEELLRRVIEFVHQIGWQLRLGEHIEGKRQDEQEAGSPALPDEDLSWLDSMLKRDPSPEMAKVVEGLRISMRTHVEGTPLTNAQYRFNRPDDDRNPISKLGKPGYEAETRELLRMAEELEAPPDEDD